VLISVANVLRRRQLEIDNRTYRESLQKMVSERTAALQDSMEKLRKALEGSILAIASTVETRDPYTAGHQQRVAELATAIAKEMGLPDDQIYGIRMGGVIHDLGKISIPAEILSKPGSITEIEFNLIKTHPKVGYDILKAIEFPWPIAQMVLQHHERMDGSGYPSGLSGEAIILEARILGVADVVEAMASHRPYRPARGIDKALKEISKNKGLLYDSNVVDACLKLFKEKEFELH
jgi:putative nucleotidyltransferase with HDIG domain